MVHNGLDLKIEITDIKDSRRWQLEAKKFGEEKANNLALKRIFQEDHYSTMRARENRRKLWNQYLKSAPVDDLIDSARDLFEAIEVESKGKITFVPGISMWAVGSQTFVDPEGKKGSVVSWRIRGSEGLVSNLYLSSGVESEISRRVNSGENPSKYVCVFGRAISSKTLGKYFGEYPREFYSTYNSMPLRVESAFNHIPEIRRKCVVRGFPYHNPEHSNAVY